MKKTAITVVGCATALFLGVAFAQDHEEFKTWMKDTNTNFASLRKTVAAKQGGETAATAEKMAGIFEQVRGHFEEHHMDDGTNFAKTGHDAAKDLVSAANSGDWEKASADLKTLGGACQGCHTAHREKLPDGSFKMK
jgi:cytochrome c556